MKLRKSADTIHNAIMNNAETTLVKTVPQVNPTPKQLRNFWKKIDKNGPIPDQSNYPDLKTPCWLWNGSKSDKGYGCFGIMRKTTMIHRISWLIHFGPTPENLHVLHKCDNRSCTNPDHLFLGTNRINVLDKIEKGRDNPPVGIRNCKAKLTEADVIEIRRLANAFTRRKLAEMFNVTDANICDIILRHTWRHI